MLGVAEKFPDYAVTATLSLEKGKEFKTINSQDYAGMWRIYFLCPKDFTFVCPMKIAAFGKLHKELQDRDGRCWVAAPIPSSCTTPGAPIMPTSRTCRSPAGRHQARADRAAGIIDENAGVAQRATYVVDPDNLIRFACVTDLSVSRNPREVLRVLDAFADRRALFLQLAEGSGNLANPIATRREISPHISSHSKRKLISP